MPDVHNGMGATVGTVVPTVSAIIPVAVGADIVPRGPLSSARHFHGELSCVSVVAAAASKANDVSRLG